MLCVSVSDYARPDHFVQVYASDKVVYEFYRDSLKYFCKSFPDLGISRARQLVSELQLFGFELAFESMTKEHAYYAKLRGSAHFTFRETARAVEAIVAGASKGRS